MSRQQEEQQADHQETFSLFDNRGDGKVYTYQVGDALRALHLNPTEAEVKKCVPQDDQEKRISYEEFLPVYHSLRKNRDNTSFEDFVEGFKVFDKEQNGLISAAELRHLMTSLGEKLTEDEVEQLIQGMEDAQGFINYEELIRITLNG